MNSWRLEDRPRPVTLLLILLLALTVLPATVVAQPDRSPRGGHGRRQQDPDREWRRKRWRRFRESLSPEEWKRFRAQPRHEQRRMIDRAFRARERRQRRERDRKLLASLSEREQARILALPMQERSRALLRLRLDRRLEALLVTAREKKLVDHAAVTAIRGEKDLKRRAARVLELQKALFLSTFSEAIEAMPEAERRRLSELPPRQFFRDRAIRNLPVVRYFDLRHVRRARRGDRRLYEALRAAQRTGEVPPELEVLLRKDRLEEFRNLPAADRRRSFQQLRGSLFRGGSGRRRGGGPQGSRGGQRPLLREFLKRLRQLPAADREALLGQPLPRVVERLFPQRGNQRGRGPGRGR